jgi:hypothetical protein
MNKTCRIYTDINGKHVMLWYVPNKKYPNYKDGKSIKELVKFAKENGFTGYHNQYEKEITQL